MLSLRLALRFFFPKHRRFTFLLSISCLCIGVACLIATLAVVSGFESSLRSSVTNFTGDVFVTTRRARHESWQQMWKSVEKTVHSAIPRKNRGDVQSTPFLLTQGIVAQRGKLAGVVIKGVPEVDKVLRLQHRVREGGLSLEGNHALIGRGLAEKMSLEVGAEFKLVIPQVNDLNPQDFRRRVKTLKVAGVLDLGKYEYDERYILTSLSTLQETLGAAKLYSGLLLSLPSRDLASQVSRAINREHTGQYRSRDWFQTNRNLFNAIVIEKRVIFLVVSIILIVAAFNLTSTLLINVVQRYRDIAILKSLGLGRGRIVAVFLWQGVAIGIVGVFGGLALGLLLIEAFQYILFHFLQIPGDVYKINRLVLEMRLSDFMTVSLATMVVCVLSTLAPAWRGSRIAITQGLSYE